MKILRHRTITNVSASSRRTPSQNAALDEFEEVHRIISLPTDDEEQAGSIEPPKLTTTTNKQSLPVRGERLQPSILDDPGVGHYKRFEKTNLLEDLNRAIDAVGKAIDTTPEGDSDQAHYLENLRAWLRIRNGRIASLQIAGRDVDIFDQVLVYEQVGTGDENNVPLRVGAPEGETIYANTPQHHGMVQLLRIEDKPGNVVVS